MTHSLFLVKSREKWYIAKKRTWGGHMESLIDRQEPAKQQKSFRTGTLVFRMLAAATLALFVVLCLLTRTANARTMLWIMFVSMTLLGWTGIVMYAGWVRPARAKARHLETLLSGEPAEHEGVLRLADRPVQIPKSVRVRRVTLEGEAPVNPAEEPEKIRLNLDENLTCRMPADGSRIRVQAVHGYITAMEVLEEENSPPEKQGTRVFSGIRRIWHRISAMIPLFVLWAMAVVILGGFVFNLITDTDSGHKIVIYADCDVRNGAELADRLERQLSDPIRMVKIHPFDYEMFETGGIRNADLYIIPAFRADELSMLFVPLPEEMREGEDLLTIGDEPYGIPICGAASAYFAYDPAETYYLVFSAASLHLSGNGGASDNRAAEAAEALLSVP